MNTEVLADGFNMSKPQVEQADSYWKFYGLTQDPFVSVVRDNKFYLSSRWEQYFDLLHYFCRTSNVILAVIGQKGCGKTIFGHLYLAQLDNTISCCQLSARSDLSPAQLQQQMVHDFSLTPMPGENLYHEDQLDSLLAQIQHRSELCLLVIDDADCLPTDTLQMLLYLVRQQSDTQMRLHIVLLGLPDLKTKLAKLATQEGEQGLVNVLDLETFTVEETEAYLLQRLKNAGLPAASPFFPAAIQKIQKLSAGIPAKINSQAQRFLMTQMRQKKWTIPLDFLQNYKTQFLGAGVLLLALLICAIIFSRGSRYPVAPISLPPLQFMPAIVTSPLAEPIEKISNKAAVKPINKVNKATFAVVSVKEVKPIKTPEKLLPKATPTVAPKALAVKTIAKKITPKKPTVLAKQTNNPANHPQQLLAANPDRYTLQLIGVSSEKALHDFINKNNLGAQARYFHSTLQGKDWYVLLYGDYATPSAAKAGLAHLPPAVQAQNPWVRKLANVQLSIRKQQNKQT